MPKIAFEKVVIKIFGSGSRTKDHHASIKKAFKDAAGAALNKAKLPEVRKLLASLEEDVEVGSWTVVCSACNKKFVEERKTSPKSCSECGNTRILKSRSDIPKTTTLSHRASLTGKIFVSIKCTDPQKDESGSSVCKKTRKVATQDLFQVKRCIPCQERHKQRARRRRTAARRAAIKKGKK